MRRGGRSGIFGVNDTVRCPSEERTESEGQNCISNGSKGGGRPCVERRARSRERVRRGRRRKKRETHSR